jgi:hypothetical protein
MRAALLGLALALVAAAPATAAPRLVEIGRFDQPVHVASPPNDPRVFVVEKPGLVKIAGVGTFLDVRSITDAAAQERGLLSIAFPPDYASSGVFYAYLTARDDTLEVLEFRRSADPNKANPTPTATVLSIPHPRENHNGGQLQFGPDGYLYVGTGDGGDRDDPDGNGQNTSTLLGKILRVVPHTGAAAPGNPFANRVWAYGLRNPWRFTFDRSAHDLIVGDVGQDNFEEVDWAPYPGLGKGANYGWPCFEGAGPYHCSASGTTPPVFDLFHGEGFAAVVGGYVVRDPGLPTLRGRYLYGDTYQSHLYSVVLPNTGQRDETGLPISMLTSFGEDACGRIYAASLDGPVYRVQDGAPTPCTFQAPGTGGIDTVAPSAKVWFAGMKTALRKRRLLVRMRANEACRAAIGTRLKKVRRLATRHRSLAAGQRKTIKLKLTRALVRKIKRRRFVRIQVTVRATDAAGNTRTITKRTRLRR